MANFVIEKKYTNNLQYITDLAKSTGIYDESLAADPNVGFLYRNWLADKKSNGYNLSEIANIDTGYLQGTDKFFYLRKQTGDLSDDEFISMFDDKESFKTTFGTVDKYFDVMKETAEKKAIYDATSWIEKRANELVYTISKFGSGVVSSVEGLIDVGASVVGSVRGIFDSQFRRDVENFIKQDTVGATSVNQCIEQFRVENIDWTNEGWTWG